MNEVPEVHAQLTKSQQLMERNKDEDGELGDEFIFFHFVEEDDPNDPEQCPEVTRTISVLAADWSEMGAPDVLTVTIEPGDQMNKDDFDLGIVRSDRIISKEQAMANAVSKVNAIGASVHDSMNLNALAGQSIAQKADADRKIAREAARDMLRSELGMGRMGY